MAPTRRQKRWSARLRTGGALVLLLGIVAFADYFLGLASPKTASSIFNDTRAQLGVGAIAVPLGALSLWLGRRWR